MFRVSAYRPNPKITTRRPDGSLMDTHEPLTLEHEEEVETADDADRRLLYLIETEGWHTGTFEEI